MLGDNMAVIWISHFPQVLRKGSIMHDHHREIEAIAAKVMR